jgi:hypothetical protein
MNPHNSTVGDLFGGPDEGGITVRMRLLRRSGEPFLLLPRHARAARTVLRLYEPQRPTARGAHSLARTLTRIGLVTGEALTISVPAPLALLLRDRSPGKQFPLFGALLGNPNAPGRRVLFLTCTKHGAPAHVIKAGFTPEAQRLIRREADFLAAAPAQYPGLPSGLTHYTGSECAAFSMAFVAGRSPRHTDDPALPALLTAWLDSTRSVPVGETAVWQTLADQARRHPLFALLNDRLTHARVHPALYHGDFAPWNVKVEADRRWIILDWERGEVAGPPLWDWLHYAIQRDLLMTRPATRAAADNVEALLASGPVQKYVGLAGCSGLERDLTLGYLLHTTEVIRPAEGRSRAEALREELHSRWRTA